MSSLKSEYLFEQKIKELGIEYKNGIRGSGYDFLVNNKKVEVKESRKYNNIHSNQYKYSGWRFNLHKHGVKEQVDIYALFIEDFFLIIPAKYIDGKTLILTERMFKNIYWFFKEKWEIIQE